MSRPQKSFWPVPALALFLLAIIPYLACSPGSKDQKTSDGKIRLVFKHARVGGVEEPMAELIRQFEEENPDIQIIDELLPPNTDQQHQFYVTNLAAQSSDFDVFGLDVIWTPEFSRAGWLLDLDDVLDPVEQEDFLSGPIEANTLDGKLYAAPWYVDGGVLFYRSDLLEKYRIAPPETFEELVRSAQFILDKESDPDLHGFIWQGKQYEGLVCTAMEFIHGNSAQVLQDGQAVIDSPAAIEAVGYMRHLIEIGITPALVTTADEEATRNIFGSGRAIYMRNWPYAWNIFQEEDSALKGSVGVVAVPHFPDGNHSATLGGWQLGINKYSKSPEAARRFVKFMVSPDTQEQLAISAGFKPSRRSVYYRPRLQEAQPFVVELLDMLENAQPRPVTPAYPRITQILQAEFSAVVAGVKPAAQAMRDARIGIDRILGS